MVAETTSTKNTHSDETTYQWNSHLGLLSYNKSKVFPRLRLEETLYMLYANMKKHINFSMENQSFMTISHWNVSNDIW